MSSGIGLLLAIAIMIGVFSLLMVLFQENHPLLKLLFLMGVLVTAFFVPTAVYSLRTTCETVTNTTTVTGNTTAYTYMQQCYTNTSTNDGADTFYTVMWSLYQIMILYFIARVVYMMFSPLWEKMKR